MIGVRLATSIKKDLHMEDVSSVFWTDSMDVLYWVKKEGPWAIFVANRVEEIRTLSSNENWSYVPGILNTADLPSQGCSVRTFIEESWWEGPSWFIKKEEEWPKLEHIPNMEVVNSEKKKTILTAVSVQSKEKYYYRYSSYVKLVRITAWITRFITNMKKLKYHRTTGNLTTEEIKRAERILLKQVQKDAFSNETDKRLNSLQVIKDSDDPGTEGRPKEGNTSCQSYSNDGAVPERRTNEPTPT
ncbi:hypothetical protein X975_08703, partial [Stegodyphus mimosarum]